MGKLVVLAVGGNSLIVDNKHRTVADQYSACVKTCGHLVGMLKHNFNFVITHGNGPQVGFILRRGELAKQELHMVPLDSCVADTQGAIGYNIQMAMLNEMRKVGLKRTVATVVTQVVVDCDDPSFKKPSKPIGSFMAKDEALKHKEIDHWDVVEDAGRGYRRVVASPMPREIIEFEAIEALLKKNVVVVAVGGGGIPVTRDKDGNLVGIEAVIDKDFASGLLAAKLKADIFAISTAVDRVYLNYGKDNQQAVEKMTVADAERYIKEGHFAPGSMLPKIQACVDFVKTTGGKALITNPENLDKALEGKAGTFIVSK